MDLVVVDLEHLPGRQLVRARAADVPRQPHDHDAHALVDQDLAHRHPAQALEDGQGLAADVGATGIEGATGPRHQVAVLQPISVLGEGRADRIEGLGVGEPARIVHADLDGFVARRQLRELRGELHGLGRRARIAIGVEQQAIGAAARGHKLDLADPLVRLDLDPHHQEHRQAGLLDHGPGHRLARALVDDVLAIAAQLGHRPHEAHLVERLLHPVLGDAQVGLDRQPAEIMVGQAVEHLRHLAPQAFPVAGPGRAGSARLRRGHARERPKHQARRQHAFHDLRLPRSPILPRLGRPLGGGKPGPMKAPAGAIAAPSGPTRRARRR